MIGEAQIEEAWGVLRAKLSRSTFYEIKDITGLAGLAPTESADLVQEQGASKGQLLTIVDQALKNRDVAFREKFVAIVAEEILRKLPKDEGDMQRMLESGYDLAQHMGWDAVAREYVLPAIAEADAKE